MTINIFDPLLIAGTLLTIAAIVLSIVQIIFKNKVNLLSFCKVSTVLPILAILIKLSYDIAQAHHDISIANDLSGSIQHAGLAKIFLSISVGLFYTMILLVIYAITKTLYQNGNGK